MTTAERPVVLVVDDEESVAEVFALWLEESYDVRVATAAEEALAKVDDDVDVVLLDRRMPGRSGDELLAEMRGRGYDVPVTMVTAVDPDLDILEMAFDDYLTKPVDKEELHASVERQLALAGYDDRAKEHFALAQKLATIEAEKTEAELESSEEYRTMRDRMDEIRGEIDELIAGMDDRASTQLFRALDRDSS